MQGQILAGVRLYNSPPKRLMYMNTSATTMLIFMYNNATAIAFILSLIYIMAPHVGVVDVFCCSIQCSEHSKCSWKERRLWLLVTLCMLLSIL